MLGVEVEDRRAREHRPDEVVGVQHDAGLLADLAQRGRRRVLAVVDPAADREPPAALRLVHVVPADEQHPVVLVEQDHARGLPEQQAVVAAPPLGPEAVHRSATVGAGREERRQRPRTRSSAAST